MYTSQNTRSSQELQNITTDVNALELDENEMRREAESTRRQQI